jgi:hypothetical protein
MTSAPRVDADFAEEVLKDLYTYRPKRRWLAWLLWATLGWFGAHRFYLERPGTGLLMLFTLGGGFMWWIVDAFFIASMVRSFGAEQERRQRAGLPPVALSFMPPLQRQVLSSAPEWTERWRDAGAGRRALRFAGDVFVLLVTGFSLGAVAKHADVWEAPLAVLTLVALASAGAAAGRFAGAPVLRGLLRWSHRLRLFYYFNRPGSPLALLLRPVTATVSAPFRRRDRAEVRLYLQLGGVFTVAFLLLDFGAAVFGPIARGGVPSIAGIFRLWVSEATITFIVIFAFATPIGAVITRYVLLMRTHTVPRLLSILVTLCMGMGLLLS